MIVEIVNHVEEQADLKDFRFGVSRFEYVWENLVDYVFGESNKDIYFPHAKWHIIAGNRTESSALEPDTIMKHDGKFYFRNKSLTVTISQRGILRRATIFTMLS